MRYTLTFFLWMIVVLISQAQQEGLNQIDSLKRELSLASQDSSQILILAKLGEAYRGIDPDSAMQYGQSALTFARKIKFHKGEVKGLLVISVVERELGNLSISLDLAQQAYKIAQVNHFANEEIVSLLRIANVYIAAKDYLKALIYLQLAENKRKSLPVDFNWVVTHTFMGEVYERMNKLDSASYHARLAYTRMDDIEDQSVLRQGVLNLMGNIEVKLSNYQLALHYYQQGIQAAFESSDHRTSSTIYTNIANLYKKRNQSDSAIHFAKLALTYGQKLSYKNRVLAASSLLSELYEPIDIRESFRYFKIAATAKDSLYGAEKIQKLQAITFIEQERQRKSEADREAFQNRVRQYALLTGLGVFLLIGLILYRNNRLKQKDFELLQNQQRETDAQKAKAEQALEELQITQAQLIQSEKMASLGELTAGIAHEIQNPLNFINNFSEVSMELSNECKQEIINGNNMEAEKIAVDISQNLEKIVHHGRRADSIVKNMLQHSRQSTGHKEPTDINALVDEYLRLSYHGLRAKDKSFNAMMETKYDPAVGKISAISQDLGRVLLNLFNNAFYSVMQKKKSLEQGYEPLIVVNTKKTQEGIEITIHDNGLGIPKKALDKIYQPFFTTKPSGEGTGLGLSLSYDIVTKVHGGTMKVKTEDGEFATFHLVLPIK